MNRLFLLAVLLATRLPAAEWEVGTLSGLMQQPASNYMHGVYGGYAGVILGDRQFILRAAYLERPRFESAGFADQEFAGFGMLGSRFSGRGAHGLMGFLGYGQITGYVRPLDDRVTTPMRNFKLTGPMVAVEYGYYGSIDVSLAHQTLVGLGGSAQKDAYVAWPYNFFLLKLGVKL